MDADTREQLVDAAMKYRRALREIESAQTGLQAAQEAVALATQRYARAVETRQSTEFHLLQVSAK